MRGRLARRISEEIERRKRDARLITFDDLLTRLDVALADDTRGPAVARWLRSRYDVALVDEFQDTDLVQWDIMRRAFGIRGSTLVLIGDPKQAIYAFRGADVFSYLQAARRGHQSGHPGDQLAQRPGAHRRLRRLVLGQPSSATSASATARSSRPPPTPTPV